MSPARRATLFALLLLAGLWAPRGGAQDGYRQPPHLSAQQVAVEWLSGRFRMPVTCLRPDGSSVELEEAVVFRSDPSDGRSSIRGTWFGIDGDFTHCYNVVQTGIPDRRGTLYLHFEAHTRMDTGASEFRRIANTGTVTFNVHGGQLQVREIGEDPGEPKLIPFDKGDLTLEVTSIIPASDGDKLLRKYATDEKDAQRTRRRLIFRLHGPDGYELVTYMIEDASRWR